MSIRKRLSTIFVIAVLSIGALASAPMTDKGARQQARTAVRSQLHLRPDQFLAVQRDELLEQSLALIVGKRAESEFIYRVNQAGDEIKENAIVHHISTDADLAYIIIVDSASGNTYRINGFPDSVAEFGKLMAALETKVSSPEQAESLVEFYRAVNPQNLPSAPLSNLLDFKQAAERQCYSGMKSFDAGQEVFTAWWNRAKPLYANVPFQQRAIPSGSGYRVEWIVLSSPSGENCGGAPLHAALEVSSNGDVGKVTLSPILERPRHTATIP